MSAEIILFVPRPNPNRDKALIEQTAREQNAVNALPPLFGWPENPPLFGYPDCQHASGIDGLWNGDETA